jgi:hypothetical protein
MNLKPLCNLICRKPTIDDAKAHCTHVCDQLQLPDEVRDEANHYWEKTFFNHFIHDVLHDKVQLMHFAPNMKERTIVMHRILKSSHNASNTPDHILNFIRQKLRRWIFQLGQSIVKKLETISNMMSPICHWNIGNVHPCRLAMVWCSSMYT